MTESPTPSPSFATAFQAGKFAFDRGQYRQAIEHFEAALSKTTLGTRQGGEAQLWMAMGRSIYNLYTS